MASPSCALVIGCMGQDGSLLSKSLLQKGTNVVGITRNSLKTRNHKVLGIKGEIRIFEHDICDIHSIEKVTLKFKPLHIFNLAGQSSVGISFDKPFETYKSIMEGTLNLLEICRRNEYDGKVFFAGSSEVFGETKVAAKIDHSISPLSPYGDAKDASFRLVKMYRNLFDLNCMTGILFNHESNLRPDKFVTQKIIKGAIETNKDKKHKISLGNINIARDWGCAEEYVEAMQNILNSTKVKDYIISTGELNKLETFMDIAYKFYDLNWKDHVEINPKFFRKTEIVKSCGDPNEIYKDNGWKARVRIKELIHKLISNYIHE